MSASLSRFLADSLAAGSHQWCKPKSDPHQSFGIGLQNQNLDNTELTFAVVG